MIKITTQYINEVREFVSRGYSPLDVARSMGSNIDDILFIITTYLS